MKKAYIFLVLIILSSFIFTSVLFLNFNIIIIPLITIVLGISLRLFFKSNFLLLYTAIFPLVSGAAFFDNKGFPFNYLMLPVFLILGIFIGEIIISKIKVIDFLNNINSIYLLFLFICFLSSFFLFIRWSNITLSFNAFFSNTPIAPNGLKLSFGVFFPLLNLFVFTVSYLYYLYLVEYKNKIKLLVAFSIGQSISIIISLSQNIFTLKFFSFSHFNGGASDSPSFGFLSSLLLFVSWYLIFKKKRYAVLFVFLSLMGILNSHSKTGIIAIVFFTITIFFYLKGKVKIIVSFIIISLFFNFIYILYNSEYSDKSKMSEELRGIIDAIPKLIIPGLEVDNISKENLFASRNRSWRYSFEIAKKYPLSGVGIGNFLFWIEYDNFGKKFRHDHSNNQYLYILSAIGFIGLGVFLLFFFQLYKSQIGVIKYFLLCVFFILLFGNYFWAPEALFAFWLFVSINNKEIKDEYIKKKFLIIFTLLLLIFTVSEIINFSSLHPKNWVKETNYRYDYGFWYPEKNSKQETYRWTKEKSGIYIYLKNKTSPKFKIFCGAPLHHITNKKQIVKVYWRGNLYKEFSFSKNKEIFFQIEDQEHSEGFLELVIDPVFNLKKMNLSQEARNLGVQFYLNDNKESN